MTAIMGPSGAGKTSLLNILTGFQTSGVDGTIKCSRPDPKKKQGVSQYKKHSCYILQDDHLAPYFSVEEIMEIATKLKIKKFESEKSKTFLINDILESLNLSHCKETRCNKLSGGQKKRLSIALELIDNPPIMFLDEPTTGLDSSSSTQCIKMLKGLAKGGRTIICTIHQPSASLYEMFDHIYVMAEGHCIYQGASLNTVPYLASADLHCPKYHNPADFLMEVATGDYGNYIEMLVETVDRGKWRTVQQIKRDEELEYKTIFAPDEVSRTSTISNLSGPSELSRFSTLLQRAFLHLYRDWTISHLRLALHICVGLLLGVMYLNYGQDGSKTFNNIGFFLVSVVYLSYTSLMPAVLKFPMELSVLKKERFNNWYNLRTYFAAFLLADIPMQILFATAYTSIAYFLSAQPLDIGRYSMVQCILILVALCASGLGFALGSIVNPVNGTFLGAIITALLLSVSGFLLFFSHIPKLLYPLSYISFMGFAMEGIVQAMYDDRTALSCPEDVAYCHYRFPELLRRDIGMEKNNFWVDVGYLLCVCIVLRVISFCNLRRKLSST